MVDVGQPNLRPQSYLSVPITQKEEAGSVLLQLSFLKSGIFQNHESPSQIHNIYGEIIPQTISQDNNKSNERIYEKKQNFSVNLPHDLE
jgi:hypothetical protein